ncbi:hypothetical protein ACFX2B_041029 [Malus domestica]
MAQLFSIPPKVAVFSREAHPTVQLNSTKNNKRLSLLLDSTIRSWILRYERGRGKAVAMNYAFGPFEYDVIIQHRLLTRTTTTRGEPPLNKLTSLFVELDKNDDNFADYDKLAKAFFKELNTKLIAAQPPQSETLKVISDLEKEIAALDVENTASSRTLELRKKQFALLLHMVDEKEREMRDLDLRGSIVFEFFSFSL